MLSRRGFLDTVYSGSDRTHFEGPDYVFGLVGLPHELAKGKPWPVKVAAIVVFMPWIILLMPFGMLALVAWTIRDMWRYMDD